MNKELCARLGNPQCGQNYIHIAGTNGKGSCSAMIAEILKCAGYKTGLFTSPHLERYTERIKINGVEISQEEWDSLYALCEVQTKDIPFAPFDIYTAIGFLKFKEEKCDFVVLEVGLGGRLDSTNVIDSARVSLLTTIGLEHTEYLGNTVGEIAMEKAGIIKEGCPVVVQMQSGEALSVFCRKASQLHAPMIVTEEQELVLLSRSWDYQVFSYKEFQNIKLSLLGDYQLRNVAAVLEVVSELRRQGFSISDDAVQQGLLSVRWPGRFEVLRKEPLVIVDGAHNANGAEALSASLSSYLKEEKLTILMGVMADKDYEQMITLMTPFARRFIFVKPESERAMKPEVLKKIADEKGIPSQCFDTVQEGLNAAKDEQLLVFGSLYQVSDIRRFFASI